MPRPTWKGTLGFGLVQLPVELFPATQEDDLDFTMLDQRNMAPVGYKRVNKKTGKEVPWGDIVKGVEVGKGKFVVIGPGDMKAAHPTATRAIDITDFVDASEISPMRWSGSYFVAPAKKASPKAYAVLRDALRQTGKVGIAKVVLRTRQHLCAVTVEGDAIVLALLRFDDELRDAGDLDTLTEAAEVKASKKELELAEKLIETLGGTWDPASYRDEYQDALRKYVAKKVKQGEIDALPEEDVEDAAPAKGGNVVDLVAALQASLEGGKGAKPGKKKPVRRRSAGGARPARAKTAKRSGVTARRQVRRAATPH
jgi:DNA end-binding protein Ku